MDEYIIQIEVNELDCRKSNMKMGRVCAAISRAARTNKIISQKTTLGAVLYIRYGHDEVADAAFDRIEAFIESMPEHDRMVISPLY